MDRRVNGEGGFTIVEVLVAILILAIGVMITFSLLSTATRNAHRAKASQVALEYAEQELEFLRSMKSEDLALEVTPPHSDNVLSPNYRVTGGRFSLSREPAGPSSPVMVVKGGSLYGVPDPIAVGKVKPGPEKFTSGDVSGKVYRYVVWRDDERCGVACPGEQDYKQIVVAVKLDIPVNQTAERGYVEVQSNFVDPTRNAKNDPLPGSDGSVVTAQQFFLTDTPCSSTGATIRQEIAGNHLLHNTLGTCASGPQIGTTKGAPDTLTLGSPPDPDPEDPNNPAFYDYSNDTYLDTTPDAGIGLQIRRDDTNGCHYTPTGTTNPQSKVHRWVTDPMTENFVMNGKVTLEFYTQSINNASSAGKICVYIFKRHEVGSPPAATDTMFTNTAEATPYWTFYRNASQRWPQSLTNYRLTMNFLGAPYTIPVGDRLGVALSVEREATPAEALSFMYDHLKAPTRIEVDTSTPIDGG